MNNHSLAAVLQEHLFDFAYCTLHCKHTHIQHFEYQHLYCNQCFVVKHESSLEDMSGQLMTLFVSLYYHSHQLCLDSHLDLDSDSPSYPNYSNLDFLSSFGLEYHHILTRQFHRCKIVRPKAFCHLV